MMKKLYLLLLIAICLILPIQANSASRSSLAEQRNKFLLAEEAIERGNDKAFFYHTKALKKYPLYPYLQYQWLLGNLHKTKKVSVFLKDSVNTRYAGSLKYRWQLYLARHRQWKKFLKHYKKTSNTKLQCYYYRAKYNTGFKKQALQGVTKLWVVGKSQPDACDPIFKVLKDSRYFTQDVLWQRFSAALRKGNTGLAKYVKRSMNKKNKSIAKLWLKVHANPKKLSSSKFLRKKQQKGGLMFAHGMKRLIYADVSKAIGVWDARKNDFKIKPAERQKIEHKIALFLAADGDKRAYQRLNQQKKLSKSAKEWCVRAALKEQNWQHVEESIAKLAKDNQKEDRWVYWSARAMEKRGQKKKANTLYNELSSHRSYYGYMSANKLNKDYELSNNPLKISAAAIKSIKQKTDFREVAEFIKVDKLLEARKQWWYSIGKLDNTEMLAAAKYAQQLKWKQMAIITVAKAKHWDDVSLRFPFDYEEQVNNNSALRQLNAAVIYGLIRRESAFNQEAVSAVGARGLMQIMPKTGRQIARKLKEKRFKKADLFNPATNIKYGAFYYKQLLDQFDGHYALAAAAYNAGPHRVKRWRPAEKTMEADIWVETIPYKETRGYVSAVLTYALIYQKQMNKNTLSMTDFMRDVKPVSRYEGKGLATI